uniref:Si:ch73-344o19.1 n=1 Tax=Oryzias latipes TaxID=8090 RepID=A0A3P9IYI2_ORYLA
MRPEVRLVFGALVLITGSPQAADLQPPAPTLALPLSHETSEPATAPPVEGSVHPESPTNEEMTANFSISNPTVASPTYSDTTAHPDPPSFSAAADSLSSTLTSLSSASKQAPTAEGRTLLSIFSSQSVAMAHSSTAPTPTQPSAVSAASKQTPTTAIGQASAVPTHQDVPSELNVGDEDLRGFHLHKNSPLDPLLAGLLSVFIVTTAVVFIALFLKFRQRMNHPEFHRLQDLPMDDLMEDTPLSRYSY